MTNIKVNYTKHTGQRSSTTINWTIGFHYWMALDADRGGLPDNYRELVRKSVQDFVNTIEVPAGKANLESCLLFEIQGMTFLKASLMQTGAWERRRKLMD